MTAPFSSRNRESLPIVGAGTTVLAAVMTGYRAVGIEVTDAYYKLGSDRVKIALEAEQKEDEK